MDYFQPEPGLMSASFQVIHQDGEQQIKADFGIVVNFGAIAPAKLNIVAGNCCRCPENRSN